MDSYRNWLHLCGVTCKVTWKWLVLVQLIHLVNFKLVLKSHPFSAAHTCPLSNLFHTKYANKYVCTLKIRWNHSCPVFPTKKEEEKDVESPLFISISIFPPYLNSGPAFHAYIHVFQPTPNERTIQYRTHGYLTVFHIAFHYHVRIRMCVYVLHEFIWKSYGCA